MSIEEEFDPGQSPLCQKPSDDGRTVKVEIYRGGGSGWILEVVDESGNSTVRDDQFPTDVTALEEAKSTIRNEGIDSLIGPFS